MTEIIQKIYLDTNVFAYAFEESPAEMQHLRDLFVRLRERPKAAVTSELTLAELLAKGDKDSLSIKRRFYLDLIVWSRFIDLQPVTRAVLLETADLRQHTKHKLPDAIHIVTAIRAQCQYFVSGDRDARKLPIGMKHIKPNAREDIQFILDLLRA